MIVRGRPPALRIALLGLAAIGSVLYVWFGPTAIRQQRWMNMARGHVPIVEALLRADTAYEHVTTGVGTGGGGILLVVGTVPTDADLQRLRTLVDGSRPPVETVFVVRIAHRVTGHGWSAAVPDGWRSPDASRPNYVESPDGTAGAYFLHVTVPGGGLANAIERARTHERELLPEDCEWQVIHQQSSDDETGNDSTVVYHDANTHYLIGSRIVGRGASYARMTFHDYYCEYPERAAERARVWLSTLTLQDQ